MNVANHKRSTSVLSNWTSDVDNNHATPRLQVRIPYRRFSKTQHLRAPRQEHQDFYLLGEEVIYYP